MSWTRRDMLESGLKAGLGTVAGTALGGVPPTGQVEVHRFFGVHPFVEANAGAVFIRRTKVAHKMDSAAKRAEGLKLAGEIFVALEQPGIPVTHRIILKPNVCSRLSKDRPAEELWGTGTDPDFYEGIVMGLKKLGLRKFYFLEANSPELWNVRGFVTINRRQGIEMNETQRNVQQLREGGQLTWSTQSTTVVTPVTSAVLSGNREPAWPWT